MSGFSILIDSDLHNPVRKSSFQALLEATARYKQLDLPVERTENKLCVAAKFDTDASLHRGITRDLGSESWLIAAGTIVALAGNNDPQTLLHNLLLEYLQIGSAALEHYDGHYALAIYDGWHDDLSVVSDPMGCFSIFWGQVGKRTFISTSALAIASLVKSEADVLTLESFLRSGIVHGERTFWNGVRRILPASVYIFSHDRMHVSKYWTPTYDERINRWPLSVAIECADEMIQGLLSRTLRREGKVWADLTGGFDTRLSALYLSKVGVPFVAYSVGPQDHPDVLIPKHICQEMGWEYQPMPLPADWDRAQLDWFEVALGKGDARLNVVSLAGVLYGQQRRSTLMKVNVTGLGVDEWREITYLTDNLFYWTEKYAYDRLLDAGILFPIPARVMRENRDLQVREEWKGYLSQLAARYSQFPNYIQSHAMFIRYRYPSHGGAYLSAASGSLRSISPFCFKAPVDFAFSLPYRWRLFYHHYFVRSLMEKENPVLADIETAKGGPAIPMRLGNLHRFWPLWSSLIERNIQRISQIAVGKPIPNRHKMTGGEYPYPAWRRAWIQQANRDRLLDGSQMHSASLYQSDALHSLCLHAETGQNVPWSFLERVLTIEMALRATGTWVNER